MFHSIGQLTEIGEEAREDFESGAITNDHLLEVGGLYLPDQTDDIRFNLQHGLRFVFPKWHCELASAVLRHRVGYGRICLAAIFTMEATWTLTETT